MKISQSSAFRHLLTGVLMVSVLFSSNLGHAEEFEELYNKGVTLYEKEMYLEAAQAFRDVYSLRPDYQYLFNIGQCEFSVRRFDLALEAFTAYLEKGGDQVSGERREYVTKVINNTKPLVGYLEIIESETFDIWIDGDPRGATPLAAPMFVTGGGHYLVLRRGRQTVFKKSITVENGKTITVERPEDTSSAPPLENMPPAADEEPKPSPSETRPTEPPSTSPLKPVGIALASIGGATFASGIATGAVYLSKKNTLEDNCPEQNCVGDDKSLYDSTNSLATATTVLFSVGGALAVTGVVLTVVGSRRHGSEREKESLVGVSPFVNADAAGVTLSGRF